MELSTDPVKKSFDPKAWVSFEGNTGPYLMYAYARSKSIIEKAKLENIEADLSKVNLLTEDVERNLLRDIYNFNNTVLQAANAHKPSVISNYLLISVSL